MYETYGKYRELLDQVLDDVAQQRLGSTAEDGTFQPWTREQTKTYIYRCFFKGDLNGFTRLLKTTYSKYDISEQQFGLMTQKGDLPTIIEKDLANNLPGSPPPSPSQVAAVVQARLNQKTPDDYVTDILDPEPEDDSDSQSKYGAEYDAYIEEHRIVCARSEITAGKEYDIDSLGYIIYRNEDASVIFEGIRAELDELLDTLGSRGIDAKFISERMEKLLFETYLTSMLSDGFRDFYIYKHSKLDRL